MRPLSPRQAHLIGVLRRADENWLELWELARRADYSSRVTAANVRELRRRGLVVTRPKLVALSATQISLNPRIPQKRQSMSQTTEQENH